MNLMALDMEYEEMWVEFEVHVDDLEDVTAWSESLIGNIRTTSVTELFHSLDH
jgi:hypothetical protein